MEIRIYDWFTLNRVGQIDKFTYLFWKRRYHEVGEFEISMPLIEFYKELFIPGQLISKENSKEIGVIEDIEINESYEENTLKIKGRFIESYANRRLIKDTLNFNGKTELAMHKILKDNVAIPNLIYDPTKNYLETCTFQATMKNVLTTMMKLSKSSGIGFRIISDFKNKKMHFETYKGVDRSSGNEKVQFSDEFGNISNIEYKYNEQKYYNVAYVGGEGEGSNRIYVTVGDTNKGMAVREVFVDAKDVRQEEGMSIGEYKNLLTQRGQEKLAEHKISESICVETIPEGNFTYKKDYDLGDIVIVKDKKWNINLKQRIVGIDEIYENGAVTIVPIVGSPIPEKIEWSDTNE